MATTHEEEIAELQRAVAGLREERDAALSQRDSDYSERAAHQAATNDVLRAMAAALGDPQPVFDLIVERARSVCEGEGASLAVFEGELLHARANSGLNEVQQREWRAFYPRPASRATMLGRAIIARDVVHSNDMLTDPDYAMKSLARSSSTRAVTAVPMLRGATPIGAISLVRTKPGGVTESQVALLRAFAEQAVIAITSAETYRTLQTRTADLQESLEYQTATSEVLKVISRSTFDLQPVLDTVAETAARLCDAEQSAIFRRDGNSLRLAASHGVPLEFEARVRGMGEFPIDQFPRNVVPRAVREGRPIHIHDVSAVPGYSEVAIKEGKQRTTVGVPLMREGEVIGVISLARQRVEPFTDRQIELVSTFSDQAVIAIENTRLINEQREALEQQTATAEVLQVINSSPGDLRPVFDAMLEKATRLCEASDGQLAIYDGENFRFVAVHGEAHFVDEQFRRGPLPGSFGVTWPRIMEGERIVHLPDVMDTDMYRTGHDGATRFVDSGGGRSLLSVALRKDETLLGVLSIYRQEARRFSDKQIALLENFAAQAVVAMENARLITEQQDALERQTAMANVLSTINASPGNLGPVFEAILEKAHALCGVDRGSLVTFDGEQFRLMAFRGFPDSVIDLARQPFAPGGVTQPLFDGARFVEFPDTNTFQPESRMAIFAKALDARTILWMPLRNGGQFLGYISAFRTEVRRFTEGEITLLENFAAQAVIAMENARLLGELRERTDALMERNSEFGERIEQQAATIDVLKVMSSTPDDTQPVFDLIARRAANLCEARAAIWEFDGFQMRLRTAHGFEPELTKRRLHAPPRLPDRSSAAGRSILERRMIHIKQVSHDHDMSQAVQELGGDSVVAIPMLRDDEPIGTIVLNGNPPTGFTDSQIALLRTFAEQAVIAIGSVTIFRALRERTAELAQRQDELRVTFENMGDGVAMFDATQHLVAWNSKFQDILDVPDEIIARRQTFAEYIRYLAERGEYGTGGDVEDQVRRLVDSAGQMRVLERVRPNGRVIEVRSNPVAGGGFVLIYADITERKRNEAEIAAARDAAQEATRTIEAAYRDLKAAQANLVQAEKMASLGQLTAGIAHEIKNPLNFVNNFADLSVDLLGELREAIAPAEASLNTDQRNEVDDVVATLTSNLQKINEHGKRADGIVKAMLEHSRGASGERRAVDINALADEALNLAYHGARAQDQSFNVALERDFSNGIAPIEVNPQDMTRVFLNLFSNGFYAAGKRARTAIPDITPKLKLSTRDLGDAVEIRVRDNGTGIPADIVDKLFQPFFTTKPTGEGTGLGLSLAYDIVTKAHGGTITVASEVDAFTEFTVTLPRNMFARDGATS